MGELYWHGESAAKRVKTSQRVEKILMELTSTIKAIARTVRLCLREDLGIVASANWLCPATAMPSAIVDILERGPSRLNKL